MHLKADPYWILEKGYDVITFKVVCSVDWRGLFSEFLEFHGFF